MAAALAVYVAAVSSMPLLIRGHLTPASHVTQPLDMSALHTLGIYADDSMEVVGEGPSNAWVVSNQSITPTGEVFTGPVDLRHCSPRDSPAVCEEWIGTLGLRQDLTYHPDSHFWPLQLAEAGIFLAVAGLLAGFCFWWIGRRLT
jgi:hypothetical protein